MLYTVTSDSTLRIFLPVLDSPQHLQLHASLDLFSALPSSIATEVPQPSDSSVFWLDREVVGASLDSILKGSQDDDDVRIRRLREIKEEGWDLFLRVFWDGSVVVSAVAVGLPEALESPSDWFHYTCRTLIGDLQHF